MQERIECILAQVGADEVGKEQRAALLLPVLQKVQRELGYIPAEAIPRVAELVGVPDSRVYGVATFYARFKFVPCGRNVITVCRGTACHVRRSHAILDHARRQLGIEPGETTPDMIFGLESVACFGCCALAPVVVINDRVYGRMTPARLSRMMDSLAKEAAAFACALPEEASR